MWFSLKPEGGLPFRGIPVFQILQLLSGKTSFGGGVMNGIGPTVDLLEYTPF